MATLNQVAEIVKNNVYAGLNSPANYNISLEQIKDEILQKRDSILKNLLLKGQLHSMEELYTSIPCVTLECKPIQECCDGLSANVTALYGALPKLALWLGDKSVEYVGGINLFKRFRIYVGPNIRSALSGYAMQGKPLAWFRDNGVWIFNAPKGIDTISLRVVVQDFREAQEYGCECRDEDELNMPGWMVDEIKLKLIEQYLKTYRMQYQIPNTVSGIEANQATALNGPATITLPQQQ